jgi:sigma-B regulation protein RsbU (phosphoserine phosphatase)
MAGQTSDPESEIAELRRQLGQREAELQIISSVQLGLAEHLDVQSIYNLVGDKIRDIFDAQVVMISTYDQPSETIEHRYAIERGERIIAPGRHPIRGFRISVVQTRQPVLVNERVAELAAELGQPTLHGTITPKTWLGVPMIVGDQVTGILSLQDLDHEYAFDEPVVRLLQTLAASMSVALENARLWEQENLYRASLEREFEIGRAIQAGFLPDKIPQPPGWEIAASLKSAREVAGDFYDVFQLGDDRVGLVIADVCDKGLGAALFMTLFRSLLRAASNMDCYMGWNGEPARTNQADSTAAALKNAVSLTNNYIAETHGHTGNFATVFFGILDPSTRRLAYVNCGHIPPLLLHRGAVKMTLNLTGPVLGFAPRGRHEVKEVALETGDLLFAYTDGVTDDANAAGEGLDIEALVPLLGGNGSLPEMLDNILHRIEAHAGNTPQFDDITMLALRAQPSQP